MHREIGKTLFTSESVAEFHHDKICDQILDAIFDVFWKDDPESRVACEVAATTGMIFIFGAISSNAVVDYAKIACDVVRKNGYTSLVSNHVILLKVLIIQVILAKLELYHLN